MNEISEKKAWRLTRLSVGMIVAVLVMAALWPGVGRSSGNTDEQLVSSTFDVASMRYMIIEGQLVNVTKDSLQCIAARATIQNMRIADYKLLEGEAAKNEAHD